jgi:hypothetical protein
VVANQVDGACVVELSAEGSRQLEFASAVDFEEALSSLRLALEARGAILLCNRYRRNAFVSSLARQMTNGLGCYLVRRGRPVEPSQIVESLGPAPSDQVALAVDARAFVAEWIASFDD